RAARGGGPEPGCRPAGRALGTDRPTAGAAAGGRLPIFHPDCVEVFPMTTTTSPIRGLSRWAASAAGLLRIYFLPLVVSALAATVWLMVVVAATEATGSVLLVFLLPTTAGPTRGLSR